MGGALISRINGVPPPGTPGLVTLNLAEVQETVEIELDTKVVHSLSEVQEGTGLISAGVQFSGSAEETRKKLLPIFRLLGLQED